MFIAGLISFLFLGLPLIGLGFSALGAIFFFVGLIMMFAAFVQNNDNEKKNRQAQRVAQQLARMGYPQAPYPQQIIVQAPPSSTHSEITHEREIVKVRCKSCSSLNFETANRCSNCGASM